MLRSFLLLFLGLCLPLAAESFPAVPASDRVLTVAEVKNYWVNTIAKRPLPPKPTGLYPEKQAQWQQRVEQRQELMKSVRGGSYDTDAKLAALNHNVEAWRLQGDETKRTEAERQLNEFKEHLARLATLEAQRRAAEAVIEMADRVRSLEAEISSLRSELAQNIDCCGT